MKKIEKESKATTVEQIIELRMKGTHITFGVTDAAYDAEGVYEAVRRELEEGGPYP